VLDAAAGAGAEGVWAGTGAGVEGAALLDDAAGVAFGLETMQTMKPFSSMLYDSTVLASWRILPVGCMLATAAAWRGEKLRLLQSLPE
jgi:hypothetical protein